MSLNHSIGKFICSLSNFMSQPGKLCNYISQAFSPVSFSVKVKLFGSCQFFLSYDHVINEVFLGLFSVVKLSLLLLLSRPKSVKILSISHVTDPTIFYHTGLINSKWPPIEASSSMASFTFSCEFLMCLYYLSFFLEN